MGLWHEDQQTFLLHMGSCVCKAFINGWTQNKIQSTQICFVYNHIAKVP